MLAASAAAALALLGGAGYAATAALTGHPSGTVLTAVSGCAGLELASVTLGHVDGSGLVITTAGGRRVTVTTAASTRATVAGALLGDITDGAPVIVIGPRSGARIAAASVTVGPPPGGTGGKGTLRVTPPPGWAVAQGTAADAGTAGFTIVTSGGGRVRATTSGGTFVVVPHASLGQLRSGVTTVAVGHAGPDGTLAALGVLQQPPGPMQVHFNVAVRGCPPASIAHALAAALGSGG